MFQQVSSPPSRMAGFTRLADDWVHPNGYLIRTPQDPVYTQLDESKFHPKIIKWVKEAYPKGVYLNQKLMAEAAVGGENVISTTPTNSGKSLAFMLPAFNKILSDPNANIIVFYPLRALGRDQIEKWVEAAKGLGLPEDIIQHIDGNVHKDLRPGKLRKGRILLATPDVMHDWFMGNIQEDYIRKFLSGVQMKIVDEVHEYDGVFGTNMMNLLLRMDSAQSMLIPDYNPKVHRQYLGASGTLPYPMRNFRQLTGVDARHIGEDQNGARQHKQHVVHTEVPAWNLDSFVDQFVDYKNHQCVIFVDSRIRVEEYTAQLRERLKDKFPDVEKAILPYKAGLRPVDYDEMHEHINSGEARIVVATSALEAGIDVDFGVGINMGLPVTKSALLQRMGRVGRKGESIFIVSTPEQKILREYSLFNYIQNAPLETPTLYPNIVALQLSAAICLRNERDKIIKHHPGARRPHPMVWPRGFKGSYERTEDPFNHFEPHQLGLIPPKARKNHPQKHLPLRSVPSERFLLIEKFGEKSQRILGDLTAEQALREYTPGAIIRHMGRKYRVNRWTQSEYGNSEIVITPYNGFNRTKSMLFQTSTTALSKKRIIGGQFKTPSLSNPVDQGFIGHMTVRVNLSVTSFVEFAHKAGGGYSYVRPYRYYDDHDLEALKEINKHNAVDYGPKRHINYETFGVVIHIPERWFGEGAREWLAERIVKAYCDKNNISPQDIAWTAKRNTTFWGEGNRITDNTLIIYERSAHQIGLLEKLPEQMRRLLMGIADDLRAEINAPVTSDESKWRSRRAGYELNTVESMLIFNGRLATVKDADVAKMVDEELDVDISAQIPEGYVPVLPPNSYAKFRRTRTIEETVRILAPTRVEGTVGYWVQTMNRKKFYETTARWVSVKKREAGPVTVMDAAQVKKLKAEKGMIVNRFVAATHISTEIKRPRLVMHVDSGKLFNVDYNPESKKVYLSPYRIADESTRSLLQHKAKPPSGGAAVAPK